MDNLILLDNTCRQRHLQKTKTEQKDRTKPKVEDSLLNQNCNKKPQPSLKKQGQFTKPQSLFSLKTDSIWCGVYVWSGVCMVWCVCIVCMVWCV